MYRNTVRGILLAGMAFAVTACQAPETLKPLPPDPGLQARVQRVSPIANLDARGLVYKGELPPTVAPLSEKTDFLGDITFIDTASAVKALNAHGQNGEDRIRHHIPRIIRACARVELQKVALAELRRQTDHVEEFQGKVRSTRKVTDILGYGGTIGGAISAFASFGKDYGVSYVLGNLIPELSDRYLYGQILDRDDLQTALSIAQQRFWYNDNDIWLDAMGDWCPAFMDWIDRHGGQLVAASERYQEPIMQAPDWRGAQQTAPMNEPVATTRRHSNH